MEETCLEQGVENSLLRNEFVADRISDRLGQLFAMTGNHALRPDGDAEKLHGMIRMEKHPNCQPGRTVAVNRGYDNDGQSNEDLERKRIDSGTPPESCLLFQGITRVNPRACSTGDVEEVRKTLFL